MKCKVPAWVDLNSQKRSEGIATHPPESDYKAQDIFEEEEEELFEDEEDLFNEEEEEKPLAPATAKDSEDTHGGEEITESISDSPDRNSGVESSPEQTENEGSGSAEIDELELEDNLSEGEGEGSEKLEEGQTSSVDSESDSTENDGNSEDCPEDGGEDSELDWIQDLDLDYGDSDYKHNKKYDLYLKSIPDAKLRVRLFDTLMRLSGLFVDHREQGRERISIKRAMKRVLNKRPFNYIKADRKKDRVSIILDTSGSCINFSDYFSKIAAVAASFDFVDIYSAPNAWIESIYDPKSGEFIVPDRKGGAWGLGWNARNVIFFGDIDGADIFTRASFHTNIFFLSCEEREDYAENWQHHSWVHYSRHQFAGKIYECFSPEDLYEILPKICNRG